MWDARTVASRLYLSEGRAAEVLLDLVSAKIVQVVASPSGGSQFKYEPVQPGIAELLDEVAHLYATDLVGVTTLVHARVDKRAVQFADAFRWKKD